ncbi:hypothetical protein MTO96_023038 [Rhipicephalus appendiculatus]
MGYELVGCLYLSCDGAHPSRRRPSRGPGDCSTIVAIADALARRGPAAGWRTAPKMTASTGSGNEPSG